MKKFSIATTSCVCVCFFCETCDEFPVYSNWFDQKKNDFFFKVLNLGLEIINKNASSQRLRDK